MDYVGPEVEDEEVKEALKLKRKSLFQGRWIGNLVGAVRGRFSGTIEPSEDSKDVEIPAVRGEKDDEKDIVDQNQFTMPSSNRLDRRHNTNYGKHVSFSVDYATTETAISPLNSPPEGPSRITSPAPTITHVDSAPEQSLPTKRRLPDVTYAPRTRRHKVMSMALKFLRSLCTPASISIIVSFIISLIPTLKALFVPDVPGTHISPAPDGLPPLSFLIDTATFIGAASVPLGLVCLGSALARLEVPKWGDKEGWARLPLGAISGLAVGKTLVMPVLGVLICQGLTNVGVIDKDDKVLRFVCM